MKDNITIRKKIINFILTSLGIILFLFSIGLAIYDYSLEQRAINTSATIVTLDYDNNKTIATVRYKVEDQTYEQKVPLPKNTHLSVKDSTSIKFDINNPDKIIHNNHEIIIGLSFVVSIILFLINLSFFISSIKNKQRINKLYKEGLYINANITEIFVNNNGKKVKNILPYRLRCHYVNPKDNKEYIFESEDTYMNLNEVLKEYNNKNIVVLLDKTNPDNYYVDLTSLIPQLKLVNPLDFKTYKEENPPAKTE